MVRFLLKFPESNFLQLKKPTILHTHQMNVQNAVLSPVQIAERGIITNTDDRSQKHKHILIGDFQRTNQNVK
jgi:hypothetical protein